MTNPSLKSFFDVHVILFNAFSIRFSIYISRSKSRDDNRADKNVIGTTSLDYEHSRLANRRVQVSRGRIAGMMMIPRSVNIRIRSREHPPPFRTPRSRRWPRRVHACASAIVPRARADNNYFRNFLAFRATSPSIRKSYKLDCHIHAQIQNTEGGAPFPPRAVVAWPVKYHLIPREIRFNFARHNIPGSLARCRVPRRPRCGESKSFDVIFLAGKMFGKFFCEERDRRNVISLPHIYACLNSYLLPYLL